MIIRLNLRGLTCSGAPPSSACMYKASAALSLTTSGCKMEGLIFCFNVCYFGGF